MGIPLTALNWVALVTGDGLDEQAFVILAWCGSIGTAHKDTRCLPPAESRVGDAAARGIGLAVAKRFLADGWRVALLDIEHELLRGANGRSGEPRQHHGAHLRRLRCRCGGGGDDRAEPALRPARRPRQQCRHRGIRAAARDFRRRTGAGSSPSTSPGRFSAPRPPTPLMMRDGAPLSTSPRSRRSRLRCTGHQQGRASHLTRSAAWHRSAFASTASHPARSKPRWRRRCTRRNPRRLPRRHSAQSLRPRRGTGRSGVLSVQRPLELHHRPDPRHRRRLQKPPALDCRRCVANGAGTGLPAGGRGTEPASSGTSSRAWPLPG